MPFQPRIAIVGGGPAGLALSLLLRQRNIESTIYEVRSKPTPEELARPSGMLDFHEESGLKLMRECGLWDEFQTATGDCSESCYVMNPQGDLLYSDEGNGSRPEIARNVLLTMFVRDIPEDCIKWKHKVLAAYDTRNPITGASEITLNLGPNGTATYDFVVGADGAWSRVRQLLTDVKPYYSGAQLMVVTARNVTTKYPHLAKLAGSGTLIALGEEKGIITHRGPQDSIHVDAAVSTPLEHWAKDVGFSGKTAAEIKTTLLNDDKLFRNWAPSLKELLGTLCDEETQDNPDTSPDIWPMYMLPVGDRWQHRTGATLVGDAAHLMTPFGGEGVNLALWDSLDLAHVLSNAPEAKTVVEWHKALDLPLKEFEEAMLSRAQGKAEETVSNQEMMLSKNGGERLASVFKEVFKLLE